MVLNDEPAKKDQSMYQTDGEARLTDTNSTVDRLT